MRVRLLVVAALVAVASTFLGAASATPGPSPLPGKIGGVIQRSATHQKVAAIRATPSHDGIVDPNLQLTYHGGPVMHTQNMYLIFWQAPGWSAFPSGYMASVEAWVNDVAADDGKTSNPFGALPQYSDTHGPGQYNVHLGGAAFDTANQLDAACGSGAQCVGELSLLDEIDNVRVAHGWSGGLTSQFAIVLPPGVSTCDFFDPSDCSNTFPGFCAYHSAYTEQNDPANTPYVFLTLPYEPATACHTPDGAVVEPEPNGQVDVLLGAMSHEMREATTDPTFSGWFDANNNESDDKCYIEYGSTIGTAHGSPYNQLINGTAYDTQLEWSNALKNCYQVGPPTVSGISPPAGVPGATVTVSGSNFFSALGTTPTVKFNGVTSPSVTVTSPTQLAATVPAGSVNGKVSVIALGGSGTSSLNFSEVPAVSGLSATSGHAGDVITVSGTGFFNVSSVTFNGVTASFGTVATNGTSLKATVPAAATDGPITVTTAAGTSTGSDTFLVLPTITSFTPALGPAGTVMTITGSGFATENGVTFVGDGDADGIPVSHSATQILIQVPSNTKAGPITVHTHLGADFATSSGSFSPRPSISGFDHATYKVGDTVHMSGGNFTANGPLLVTVNGVLACLACSRSATSVTFNVPNTVSGTVTVSDGVGTATSPSPLLIVPRIDSVRGGNTPGSNVLLTGAAFAGTTSVAFGNNTEHASFVVGSGGSTLSVILPANATTGKIGVTNAGGTTLTTSDFVVPTTFSVKSFSPARADYGQTVSITGSGFTGVTAVQFNGVPGTGLAILDDSHLTVRVPASGSVTGAVTLVNGTTIAAPGAFTLLHISSFSPSSAQAGATVVITGAGFTGATRVRFAGQDAAFTVDSDSQITATVPAGALSGPITVTVVSASVTSSARFGVQPGP